MLAVVLDVIWKRVRPSDPGAAEPLAAPPSMADAMRRSGRPRLLTEAGAFRAVEAPASPETGLLLRFARAGHGAGYSTAELEERVLALARAVGIADAQISVTPTVIDVSIGVLRPSATTLRVRPATVDLDAIARLDELVQDVLDQSLDVVAPSRRFRGRKGRLRRPWPLLLAAYALAGAALTPSSAAVRTRRSPPRSWVSWWE